MFHVQSSACDHHFAYHRYLSYGTSLRKVRYLHGLEKKIVAGVKRLSFDLNKDSRSLLILISVYNSTPSHPYCRFVC